MSVRIAVIIDGAGVVRCGRCRGEMRPATYRSLEPNESDREWLFWVCVDNSGHVTAMIPLPLP